MEVKRFGTPVFISFFVHAAFCAMLLVFARTNALKPVSNPIIIELEPLPKRAVDDRNRQVVQSTAGQKSKEAAPDAFLGKETRTVDRETVTKLQTSAVEAGAKQKASRQARQQEQARSEERAKNDSRTAPLAKFGVAMLPREQMKPRDTARWADFAETFGAVPTDYVKGLKESETTALNTREFAYYSYFQRIRTQLDRAWQSILKEKLQKLYWSGRSLASDQDHTTKTVVTLDAKGEITKVQLLEESGVVDLDDAAVRAFNKAGPFPNPPREMVDKSGEIQIRWDFILKT